MDTPSPPNDPPFGEAFPNLDIEEGCVCPTCKMKFKGSSQLTMHVQRRHDGCKLPVKTGRGELIFCPVEGCHRAVGSGQPFPRLGQLKQHYHSVHSTKEYSCERCGKTFGLKNVCIRHQAECGSLIECGTCKDTFRTKNALYQHAKRKKHKLPEGSKPRGNRMTQKSPNSGQKKPAIPVIPIIVKQVVKLPSLKSKSHHEIATQTDPESTAYRDSLITHASNYSSIHQVDASTGTQFLDLQVSDVNDLVGDADTILRNTGTHSLDASTNTASLQYPSSLEQLTDASTNTVMSNWGDPTARVLVDAGTSTLSCATNSLLDPSGQTVDLATQTNFQDLATLACDLATQTQFEITDCESHDFAVGSVCINHQSHDFNSQTNLQSNEFNSQTNLQSHDFNSQTDLQSHDFNSQTDLQSHDFNTISVQTNLQSHDFSSSPDFQHPIFNDPQPSSDEHIHIQYGAPSHYTHPYIITDDTKTTTSTDTADYGVQTSDDFYEISQLLSDYEGTDFGTQTSIDVTENTQYDFTQLSDFSTQTQNVADFNLSDSFTQTHTLNDSGTQTLSGSGVMSDFGTQTAAGCGHIGEFGTQT